MRDRLLKRGAAQTNPPLAAYPGACKLALERERQNMSRGDENIIAIRNSGTAAACQKGLSVTDRGP
jgi:hypothetical protein